MTENSTPTTPLEVIQWTLKGTKHSHAGQPLEHPFGDDLARALSLGIQASLRARGYQITPTSAPAKTIEAQADRYDAAARMLRDIGEARMAVIYETVRDELRKCAQEAGA